MNVTIQLDAASVHQVKSARLGVRLAPRREAEQASDHEQAGAGLGDQNEAEATVADPEGRIAAVAEGHCHAARVVAEARASDSTRGAGDERLVPLPGVSALVERAVGTRRS